MRKNMFIVMVMGLMLILSLNAEDFVKACRDDGAFAPTAI